MQHPMKNLRSLIFCFAIFFSVSLLKQIEAKRGCSSFGHSCFGGHGKRSEVDSGNLDFGLQNDQMINQQGRLGQDEVAAPKPIYPQSIGDLLANGDDIIPIRNGGFNENSDEANMEQLKLRLSPYLRHWLIAYRKAQENKNGYPYNNMI